MIYDEYIDISRVQQEKYGKRTVVFMQVGDFFEIYAVNNEEEQVGADIYTVCDICNLQVSRKNKTLLENNRQNPLMAGFPMSIVSKHIQTMVEHGYTVVVIRQVTSPPNPRREITEVISPATQLQPQGTDHAYLMVLYWESIPVRYGSKQYHWAVGMAAVDISTGDVVVAEALPRAGDGSFAKDEAYRWIQMFQPRELVMAGATSASAADGEREALFRDLQIDTMRLHRKVHDQWDVPNLKVYQKPAYQTQLFEKLWGSDQFLDLERNDAIRIALVHAVQFIFEHNESMLRKMKLPTQMKATEHCSVHYNALHQLNVLSHTPGERPLAALLNRCSTAFGSRLFKERLLNPVVSKGVLTRRYDEIAEWMEHPAWMQVKKHLGSVLDLERFARRLVLRQLAPCEWVPIAQSLQHVEKLLECMGDSKTHPMPECARRCFNDLRHTIDTYVHLEEAARYWMNDIRGSMFHTGHYPELDAIHATTMMTLEKLGGIAHTLSGICGGEDTCKLENNDRYGYYLSMTKKRWESVLTKEPPFGFKWKEFKTVALSSSSSVLRITHPVVDDWSNTFLADQKKLASVALACYKDFLETHGDRMASHLEEVVAYLGNLDVALTNARNALDFCYARPSFANAPVSSASYIKATAMRHPIIERLQTQVPYVPNDVALGGASHGSETSPAADGWLLYGINAAGKSSLMKAIGLNLLMAQAGMFVPCESFEYEPYHSIFTRISGADNIYRGMSSFTVEMTELRNILLRCDERSLVLGDELCAGTEALSALSIVAAGVETLADRKTSFVFATHLHELTTMGFLPKNVAVFHIHIHIDPETHEMTFDRHLTPGSGHAYYGLEVCRALKMPDAFLSRAHHYRRTIQEEPATFLNVKPSNYNKAVFMDACAICSKPATETHHIQYQKYARVAGTKKHVLHIPIHSAQNLVPLCDACHAKEHNGHIKIKGFRQTSMGRILVVDYANYVDGTSGVSVSQ